MTPNLSNMRYLIIALISQILFITSIQYAAAEEILLVVPGGIDDIHYGIKITTDNMNVRKFEKSVLPGRYLTPEEFESVINKTVSEPVKPGFPIPYESIIPLWKQFSSDEGAFSVMMPGTPESSKEEANQQTGPQFDTYSFEVEQGDINLEQGDNLYSIRYMDLPPDYSTGQGTDSILTKGHDNSLKFLTKDGRTIKQLNESDISLDSYSGFEIKATVKDGEYDLFISQRAYLVENRIYQLAVTSLYRPTPAEDVQKFFQSFKFLGP